MIEYGERFRCFDCYHQGHDYCGNKKRLKELKTDNCNYDPMFDGMYCDYYYDEDKHYIRSTVKWRCQDFLKGINDIIELWKFKQEHWNIESLYGVD